MTVRSQRSDSELKAMLNARRGIKGFAASCDAIREELARREDERKAQ